MSYHVDLELSPSQRKRLKLAATEKGQSVKDFVTELVTQKLDGAKDTKTEKK